jgi:hypothetical protein
MAVDVPQAPEPDAKDWTWVLTQPCPDCGFDAAAVPREHIPARLLATNPRWTAVLTGPAAARRPSPAVWSPLEYGCHVRDVHRVFALRGRLILDEADPEFADWDQDETALTQRYWEADPAAVAAELTSAGEAAADVFGGLDDAQWSRAGRRSNGSVFTMESLALYYLHDVEHHLHDVVR